MEEVRTDNTETLKNALERNKQIAELEKERELLFKRIDKYKEDLKKLRVAFIQLQVEHLCNKSFPEIVETILGGE